MDGMLYYSPFLNRHAVTFYCKLVGARLYRPFACPVAPPPPAQPSPRFSIPPFLIGLSTGLDWPKPDQPNPAQPALSWLRRLMRRLASVSPVMSEFPSLTGGDIAPLSP
jgi:hypothetical protein